MIDHDPFPGGEAVVGANLLSHLGFDATTPDAATGLYRTKIDSLRPLSEPEYRFIQGGLSEFVVGKVVADSPDTEWGKGPIDLHEASELLSRSLGPAVAPTSENRKLTGLVNGLLDGFARHEVENPTNPNEYIKVIDQDRARLILNGILIGNLAGGSIARAVRALDLAGRWLGDEAALFAEYLPYLQKVRDSDPRIGQLCGKQVEPNQFESLDYQLSLRGLYDPEKPGPYGGTYHEADTWSAMPF